MATPQPVATPTGVHEAIEASTVRRAGKQFPRWRAVEGAVDGVGTPPQPPSPAEEYSSADEAEEYVQFEQELFYLVAMVPNAPRCATPEQAIQELWPFVGARHAIAARDVLRQRGRAFHRKPVGHTSSVLKTLQRALRARLANPRPESPPSTGCCSRSSSNGASGQAAPCETLEPSPAAP